MQIPSYKNIKDFISKEEATVPPSVVIAGVYAHVDRTRGVWKASANVSLNSVFVIWVVTPVPSTFALMIVQFVVLVPVIGCG